VTIAPGPSVAVAEKWEEPPIGDTSPVEGSPWQEAQQVDLSKEDGYANVLDYAPDGKTLYLGFDDGHVIAWDLAAGKRVWSVQALKAYGGVADVRGLQASPRGDKLVVWRNAADSGVEDLSAHVLDAASGQELQALGTKSFSPDCAHRKLYPYELKWDADGALYGLYLNEVQAQVSGDACDYAEDNTVIRWDADTGEVRWKYRVPLQACGDQDPCPGPMTLGVNQHGGNLAGGGCDGSLFFLDKATGLLQRRTACAAKQDPTLAEAWPDFKGRLGALAWAPDGQRLWACYAIDSHLASFEHAGEGQAAPIKVHGRFRTAPPDDDWKPGRSMAVSPDGKLVAAAQVGVFMFDATTGKLVDRARGKGGQFAFNPRQREWATLDGSTLLVHRPAEGGSW
jgi:WD40 repeat protein